MLKSRFIAIVLALCLTVSLAAQTGVTTRDSLGFTARHGDSATVVTFDTMAVPNMFFDSIKPGVYFKPYSARSVWYALVFPGLGQIYNRRYWKVPIVYGGFAGLIFAIQHNAMRYSKYVRAYRDLMDTDPTTNSYQYLVPLNYPRSSTQSYLEGRANSYRRYRDLCIAGIVGFYAMTVIDAFVDAQLADFDVSPDLSMKVAPALLDNPYNAYRPSLGMNVRMKF